MDIKVLLTSEEVENEVAGDDWLEDIKFINKAQCLKLIAWMEDEGIIAHDNYSEFTDYEKNFKNWHRPDCWLCKLKEALEG